MNKRPGLTLLVCLLGLAGLSAPLQAQSIQNTQWIDELGLQPGVPLVILPPAAGAIIGIDEQRKIDSYVQTITLQGDPGTTGENRVVVTVTRKGLAPRITPDVIQAELADAIPDIPVSMGPINTRNVFGLFGSLIGSRGPLTCFYGFQGVNLADRWITTENATPFDERHALSIRARLCRTTIGAAGLTAIMAGAQSGAGSGGEMAPMPSLGYDALAAASSLDGMQGGMQRGMAPGMMGNAMMGNAMMRNGMMGNAMSMYAPQQMMGYEPSRRVVTRYRAAPRVRARPRRRDVRTEEPVDDEAPSSGPTPIAGLAPIPLPRAGVK